MLDLRRTLTARVGGCVRSVTEPRRRDQMVALIDQFRQRGRPFRVLGGGSNVLAIEDGRDEPVVLTRGLRRVEEVSRTRWRVEAGANLTVLGHLAARRGLSGLECCAGIPGTVGAAVRINAGGRFGNIGSAVREVTVLDEGGRLECREAATADFGYRRSSFWNDLVLEAELEFEERPAQQCTARVREVLEHKRQTQPLRWPSAGCIFRNPVVPGYDRPVSAGWVIDRAGLKGARVGGAMVSPVHANYIVNVGHATGRDFLALIRKIRERVREHAGVELELEVDVWD